jgi:hypothetical protein
MLPPILRPSSLHVCLKEGTTGHPPELGITP